MNPFCLKKEKGGNKIKIFLNCLYEFSQIFFTEKINFAYKIEKLSQQHLTNFANRKIPNPRILMTI